MKSSLIGSASLFSVKNTTMEISISGINTAVLSAGATEQFGPYLPMHLDTLIAELYADACRFVSHVALF